jgi:hypothetical protein
LHLFCLIYVKKQLAASLPKAVSIIKTLHKPKASATKLFESNDLVTLRMAHKVDEMKEQQQNSIALFNNNNPFARSQSEETHVRSKGQNARIILFNNIFRQKLETKFTTKLIYSKMA